MLKPFAAAIAPALEPGWLSSCEGMPIINPHTILVGCGHSCHALQCAVMAEADQAIEWYSIPNCQAIFCSS